MKTSFRLDIGKFVFDAGWYKGEDFKLLDIMVLDFGMIPYGITIFNFQIAKFMLTLCLNR